MIWYTLKDKHPNYNERVLVCYDCSYYSDNIFITENRVGIAQHKKVNEIPEPYAYWFFDDDEENDHIRVILMWALLPLPLSEKVITNTTHWVPELPFHKD